MSDEIKQGDTVRASEKTPIEYNPHGEYAPLCVINSVVRCVVNDYAMCEPIWDDGAIQTPFLIPTKYLIKVDAEAKEAKFKVGDRVMHKGVLRSVDRIDTTTNRCLLSNLYYYAEWVKESDLEPYTEPTEQTETKTKPKGETLTFPICFDLLDELESCDSLVSIRERMRKALKEVEAHNKPRYVPKIMFNTEFWVKYEADLAKEVALKVANKYSDPKEAAEYAVLVAKAVVEGLKRK